MSNPVTGVGFRNFGEEFPTISPETGELSWTKDTAHGFFPSVAAEHGIMLACVLLVALLILLRSTFAALRHASKPAFALFCVVTGIIMSENFSCTVYNAFAYHLIIFLPMLTGSAAMLTPSSAADLAVALDRRKERARNVSGDPPPLVPGSLCL